RARAPPPRPADQRAATGWRRASIAWWPGFVARGPARIRTRVRLGRVGTAGDRRSRNPAAAQLFGARRTSGQTREVVSPTQRVQVHHQIALPKGPGPSLIPE